jgi:hypothetical protein
MAFDGNGSGFFGGRFSNHNPLIAPAMVGLKSTAGGLATDGQCNFAGLFGTTVVERSGKPFVWAVAETATSLFLGGRFSSYADQPVQSLIKVDKKTCALDSTFSQSSGISLSSASSPGDVYALAIAGDSLYVGGYFFSYRGQSVVSLVKLDLASGVMDEAFSQATTPDSAYVSSLAVSGSSLFVGGGFTSLGGTPSRMLAKVSIPSGSVQAGFLQGSGASAGFDSDVTSLAVSGNSLFVGGGFNTYAGVPAQKLAKIAIADGALDTTFTQSTGFNSSVLALSVHEGFLFAGGAFDSYRDDTAHLVAKIDAASGALDSTFNQGMDFGNTGGYIQSLSVSGDAVFVAGEFSSYRGSSVKNLAKLNRVTGALDTTFSLAQSISGAVYYVHASDSIVLVGGYFTAFGGNPVQNLAKIDLATGALDPTFAHSSGANGDVLALLFHSDSLYLGGDFTSYGGATAERIAKVDAETGAVDANFTQGSGFTGRVSALASSGTSLYVGGWFSHYRGTTAERLAKINMTTGVLDTTFTGDTGASGGVNALVIADNALYLGGQFSHYRNVSANYLAKVNLTSGALDTTFTQGSGPSSTVYALAASASALYVGGQFTSYRGTTAHRLAKISLTNGELDTTFTESTGPNNQVMALAVDGSSLYVGGYLTTYRGTTANRLAKVDLTSGALDTGFTQPTGFDAEVTTLGGSGTSLYVGGDFSSYRASSAPAFTVLNPLTGALGD